MTPHPIVQVVKDEGLRVWFDEFVDYSKKALEDVCYAVESNEEELEGKVEGVIVGIIQHNIMRGLVLAFRDDTTRG